jgi:regulation of enolase protein 1 (concanavalin A-like superfamily)
MLTGKTGDFTIETKVMATTDQEWESAGILVWKDASNFLRLDRACGMSNTQRIVFIMARNDGWDPIDVVLSSNINPTYLKITKTVDKFTAFYSINGADWTKIGEKTFSVSDPLDVGLDVVNVYHDGLFFADFDFFRVISPQSVTTTIDISCKSSTSYSGFNVEIKGRLVLNGISLPNAPILISYSVTGGKSWEDLTLVNTGSDGRYSTSWLPSVTGNYLIKAFYEGGASYPGTSKIVNFAVTQFAEKTVFSVLSDSAMSSLAFNSVSRELSFTVTGESGTTGYVDMYVARSVIGDITGVKAYLDGVEIGYSATAVNDSWLFHFSYQHSTHAVLVSLGPSPSVFSLDSPLGLAIIIGIILIVIVAGVLVALRKRKASQGK